VLQNATSGWLVESLVAFTYEVGPELEIINDNVTVYKGTLHVVNVEEFILIPNCILRIYADLLTFYDFTHEHTTINVLFNVHLLGKFKKYFIYNLW